MNRPLRFVCLTGALALMAFGAVPAHAQAGICDPRTSATACNNQPCNTLGTTAIDSDHASIIACVLTTPDVAAVDCASGGGCTWQGNPGPPLIHVSFELVGAGGGGGAGDCCPNTGGNGASGQIQQFDAWLHRGSVLTVSVGSGGAAGVSSGGCGFGPGSGCGGAAYYPLGGSGLFAKGGVGGVGTGSGSGGGGGAGSVVMGDGLFAVAGGGGGGGGGAGYEDGLAGNVDWNGPDEAAWLPVYPKQMPGMDGQSGYEGCASSTSYYGTDGGGGGGGGGGYPGGKGGFWGCDNWGYTSYSTAPNPNYAVDGQSGSIVSNPINETPGYPASGGANGSSYLSASYGTLPFSKAGNSAGIGAGGSGTLGWAGSQGQCGRVTIWSSTGVRFQFDCNTSVPQWIVQ